MAPAKNPSGRVLDVAAADVTSPNSDAGRDMSVRCLLGSLLRWYNEDVERVRRLVAIITRKDNLSLRVIDWMVTNYSRQVPVSVAQGPGGIPQDLYRDYQQHLSAFNKKNFDPFARRGKIHVQAFGKPLRTTIGQMNFFKWFLERDLGGVLAQHRDTVERHMKRAEVARRASGEDGAPPAAPRGKGLAARRYEGPFEMF